MNSCRSVVQRDSSRGYIINETNHVSFYEINTEIKKWIITTLSCNIIQLV